MVSITQTILLLPSPSTTNVSIHHTKSTNGETPEKGRGWGEDFCLLMWLLIYFIKTPEIFNFSLPPPPHVPGGTCVNIFVCFYCMFGMSTFPDPKNLAFKLYFNYWGNLTRILLIISRTLKCVETYSTNHVYLYRPNAFGFWQPRLHLCYETLKRVSNYSELA